MKVETLIRDIRKERIIQTRRVVLLQNVADKTDISEAAPQVKMGMCVLVPKFIEKD